ncbi:hypothetical protein V6N11_081379 [Hibiscus sabdariffa]|uniref:Uncharacterized protein n=1 Tax=Hibiscus sabdariffa TaxID=183260 RepID=A0ABR2QJN5_9ROSI
MRAVLKQFQVDGNQNLPEKKHGICRGRVGEPAMAALSRIKHISCQCRFSRRGRRFYARVAKQSPTKIPAKAESASIRDWEAYQILNPSPFTKKMTWSARKIF